MRFEPRLNNVVVPIVYAERRSSGYVVQGVLGTAFPVPDANEKVFLVSAGHVLRSEMSDNHVVCALFFTRELTTRVYPIENPRFDLATDLASCPVNVDPNSGVEIVPFQITKDNVEQTQTVFVHEFSYTRSARGPTGHREMSFFPITHKGNVVAHIRGATCEHADEPVGIYWLSEQMFEGASGAPVLRESDMAVCGVVLGNQAELDSAAYLSGDEKIKRGFGVAVQAGVVKLALDRMGIMPNYLD